MKMTPRQLINRYLELAAAGCINLDAEDVAISFNDGDDIFWPSAVVLAGTQANCCIDPDQAVLVCRCDGLPEGFPVAKVIVTVDGGVVSTETVGLVDVVVIDHDAEEVGEL